MTTAKQHPTDPPHSNLVLDRVQHDVSPAEPLVDEDGVEYFGRTRRQSEVSKTLTRRRQGRLASPLAAITPSRADPPVAKYSEHPACAVFPLLGPEALAELADDIEAHGLLEPIVVFGGQIIDGRNRLRACEIAGEDPEFREWEGEADEIVSWVISKNLHRRHLDTSQRAMVAARLATLEHGGDRSSGQLAACSIPTQAEAASMLNVGERSVRRAREVLEEGSPELVRQVELGEVSVSNAAEQVRPPRSRVSALLADVELGAPTPATSLPNDQRALNDGYWTPFPWARACVRWLDEQGLIRADMPDGTPGFKPGHGAKSAIEPAVGGGSWITAFREVKPDWSVDRFDIEPSVPGLTLDLRETEDAIGRSWLELLDRPRAPKPRRWVWDLCLGNPPYQDATDGDLLRFLEVSLARSWTCAFLLRETFTGTGKRLPWWTSKHRPAWIVKTVGTGANSSRPKWEGPGRRDNSDSCDTVLVVWTQRLDPKTKRTLPTTETRFDWLEVPG